MIIDKLIFVLGIIFIQRPGIASVTKVQENVELRVFNRDDGLNSSVVNVSRLLKSANLEYRGYKKVVMLTYVKKENSKTLTQKIARFTKTVPCSQLLVVEKQLSALLPGVFDSNVATRVRAEAAGKRFGGERKLCEAGVEIHFPPTGGFCKRRKNKRGLYRCSFYCLFCFFASQ